MGFEPQIKMILQNIRPDRQTVLFSATFPKQIEKLAKSILKAPLEIVVGERSTVNKDIAQIVSLCICVCLCVITFNYDLFHVYTVVCYIFVLIYTRTSIFSSYVYVFVYMMHVAMIHRLKHIHHV